MTQTVSGLYPSRQAAEAAADDLRQAGFEPDAIELIAPSDAPSDAPDNQTPDDQTLAAIRRSADAHHAALFADAVKSGQTLLSVQAPFGLAARAVAILKKHNPTDAGTFEHYPDKVPPDPATPLSSACGWTVLIDDPAPLSRWLNLPLLTSRQSPKPTPPRPDDPAPLSNRLHWPILAKNPAPLSTRLGWRTLWNNPAPLSTRLGWPILAKTQTSRTRLSQNPTPLSSALGLKLLSHNPAPLSRLFGWKVLSNTSRNQPEQ